MDNALVSVILPVYNGEGLLAEAIRSVLEQKYRPFEIILIDDGSTDTTARVAAGFGNLVHYDYQSNSGPAAARNLGVREAHGEFITFIDADDLWPPDKLCGQMRCFEAFPSVDIVQGLIKKINLPHPIAGPETRADIDFPFIYTNLGSMVMRRSVFEKIGYFEESLRFHEDTDFWLRAREQGIRILVQRKIALLYRIHGRNLTTGKDMKTTGFLNILRRSITRRRESSSPAQEVGKLTFMTELQEKDQPGRLREKETQTWPLVTIVLYANVYPVKLGQALSQAIASIRAQHYQAVELIVVGFAWDQGQGWLADGLNPLDFIPGDTDLASGLNAAIQRSHGEMIAFLDAEAEWVPRKLKTRVAYLLDHPHAGFVVGRSRLIILPEMKYPPELLAEVILRKNLGDALGSLLVRRSTYDQVGGFEAGLPGMEGVDWLLRANDRGFPKKTLPDTFLFQVIQPDSRGVGTERMKAALLESLRSSVHRKHNPS